jgi:hypothetical protein
MPQGLAQALGPFIHQIAEISVKVKEYDKAFKLLNAAQFPETRALTKVYGVGDLTAAHRAEAHLRCT